MIDATTNDISKANLVTGTESTIVKKKNILRVAGVAPTDANYVEVGVYDITAEAFMYIFLKKQGKRT